MSTRISNERVPQIADVDRISAERNPVLRNLLITQCYHELALVMTRRTGVCTNWCTIATWASKQAGRTIRQEDLERALDGLSFTAQAEQKITASAHALDLNVSQSEFEARAQLLVSPQEALDHASDAIARGNKKVFDEIGREFARFYAECLEDTAFSQAHIDGFCESLRTGEPPEGQAYLQRAFRRYYQAFFEEDARKRAELVFLANIEIGFHEQTRLQPEIAEAMEAAVMDRRQFQLSVIRLLFPFQSLLAWLRLFLRRLFGRRTPFDDLLDTLLSEARRQARYLITRYLMTIEVPVAVRLRLSEDIPGVYPPSLAQPELPDLRDMLMRVDRTPDSTRGSGVVDWAALNDRMHFIAEMFRCYHENANLYEPPFTPEQVNALRSGRIPDGPL